MAEFANVNADTIIAPATPPGEGAIGVIRLSGSRAISLVENVFKGKKLSAQPSHTLHFGRIFEEGQAIDEVVAGIFRGPHSYTGEDIVELSCHGSPYIIQRLLTLFTSMGARMAGPGEFTQRAFLNGKMDLTQAEAVADLIAGHTSAAHHTALHNLRGGFSAELRALREQLIEFSALIELELDFSEEDVEFADRTKFYQLINAAESRVQRLVDSFVLGNAIKNGVSVAIVGAPNAGKSTLLNTLLNEERAIVSEIAGTTRDTIEETLNINGVLFRLIDTAGIREHTSDVIEQMGVGRSLEKMRQAEVVVYLYDVRDDAPTLKAATEKLKLQEIKYLIVGNKDDLLPGSITREKFNDFPEMLFISAKTGLQVEELKDRLFSTVIQSPPRGENTIITNVRHHAVLKQVLQALNDIRAGLDSHISGDLLAPNIRQCLYFMGEITGNITNEDVLDYVFSKFCIGK